MSNVFIIAEAGVNHNGSEELALQLVEVAAKAGADAVKFQTFKAESLVAQGTATAEYQKQQTGCDDQFAMLKGLEMSVQMHEKVLARCEALGIEFMSTPFDLDAADFLIGLGMTRLKVPSGELTNLPFIRRLAAFNQPMILSTGMATLEEVGDAIKAIRTVRQAEGFSEPLERMLTILHCTSNYPAKDVDVNLRAMQTLADTYQLPVGYSDHTSGIVVSVAAVAMGAQVIEKHFTLDVNLPGPDHKASLTPEELTQMVADIRRIEACLGDGIKAPKAAELPVRELVRRSLVLVEDKPAGAVLSEQDFVLLRPGSGIAPKEIENVVGRSLRVAKKAGSVLQWDDIAS